MKDSLLNIQKENKFHKQKAVCSTTANCILLLIFFLNYFSIFDNPLSVLIARTVAKLGL